MVLLDVPEESVEPLITELAATRPAGTPVRLAPRDDGVHRAGVLQARHRRDEGAGARLTDELERRIPDFDTPITINVNGCPNSCARIQVADIGLKGQLVLDDAGNQVEGFQVHLGGGLALDAGFGRKVRGLKVTAEQVTDYVEKITRHYLEEREDGERFATWSLRADEEVLTP